MLTKPTPPQPIEYTKGAWVNRTVKDSTNDSEMVGPYLDNLCFFISCLVGFAMGVIIGLGLVAKINGY